DVPIDTYSVVRGGKRVSLRQCLKDIGMWAQRDETVLATTQTAIIPEVPGGAEYFPEVRSYAGNANVMLATYFGTSNHVVQTTEWMAVHQIKDGERFTFKATSVAEQRGQTTATKQADLTADERMRNLVLIVVIPTKKPVTRGTTRGG